MKKILCAFLLLATVFFNCVSSGKKDSADTDIALTRIPVEKKVINDRKAYVAGSFAVVKEGDLSRYVNLPKKDQTGAYSAEIGEIFGFRKDNEKLCEVTTAVFFEVNKTAGKKKNTFTYTVTGSEKAVSVSYNDGSSFTAKINSGSGSYAKLFADIFVFEKSELPASIAKGKKAAGDETFSITANGRLAGYLVITSKNPEIYFSEKNISDCRTEFFCAALSVYTSYIENYNPEHPGK